MPRTLVLIACCLSSSLFAMDTESALAARKALFSAQYDRAAEVYSALVKGEPGWDYGHYGLVRALLAAERAHEAYAAADAAAKMAPGMAGTETAQGMVAMRRGEIAEAETHFRNALRIDQKYSPALRELAHIFETVSKFESARVMLKEACDGELEDPDCILRLAADTEGPEHLASLERAAAIYNPESRQARRLRVEIHVQKSLGGRKPKQLVTSYQSYELPLERLVFGPHHDLRGPGIRVTINKRPLTLLLDTGTSGVWISRRAAKNMDLEELSDDVVELPHLLDVVPASGKMLLGKDVEIGALKFKNVPIIASDRVPMDADGIIGASFFERFLVSIDFYSLKLTLEAFPTMPPDHRLDAPDHAPQGFVHVFRRENLFLVPTAINRAGTFLFLIDSGIERTCVDEETARHLTVTQRDFHVHLRHAEKNADKVSKARQLDLSFAGFQQDNEGVIAVDLKKAGDGLGIGVAGLLGIPAFNRMSLTLNYVEGAVRFEYHK